MTQAPAVSTATRPGMRICAFLEFPQSSPIRDIERVTQLFCGLLRACGEEVRHTGRGKDRETWIETHDYRLSLSAAKGELAVKLESLENADDPTARRGKALLWRLLRAASAALRPTGIRWPDGHPALDISIWLATFRPVLPNKVREHRWPHRRTRRPGIGVEVWPNRPCDQRPNRDPRSRPAPSATSHADDTGRALCQPWKRTGNRFDPEPACPRLATWMLTGTTMALCPPAGASMAVLTLARRADLRLNLHALTLTLVILSLQQSGVLATAMRALGS